MASQNDLIVVDPNAPDDDLDGDIESDDEYLFKKQEQPLVLGLVRGNRCVCPQWTAYQNVLLAEGRYTFEELWHRDALCTFDAWHQAHEQDRAFEAAKAARSIS